MKKTLIRIEVRRPVHGYKSARETEEQAMGEALAMGFPAGAFDLRLHLSTDSFDEWEVVRRSHDGD